jgi:4'-phosphopantetheinyl transferase EntD
MSSLISTLLPEDVVAAETLCAISDSNILPEELADLGDVADTRRLDFIRGRSCAHRALETLGCAPEPLLSGSNREPRWPKGVVGSITHCRGYTAAAVAFSSHYAALGIDAEEDGRLPEGVINHISTAVEREWLRNAVRRIHWDRLLFSAKESVFKAWFPLTSMWLGFEDAVITFEPHNSTFIAHLLVDPIIINNRIVNQFYGRFKISNGFILTAIIVPLN